MIPAGAVLGAELANIHKPKYSIRKHTAAILYKCPECSSFNMLERSGQLLTKDEGNGIYWMALRSRWFTCGDCDSSHDEYDVIKVNRKRLTDEEKTAVLKAVIAQDSRPKLYDILKRNNHAMNPPSEYLVELYAKWLPDDPLSPDHKGEL